MQQRKQVRPANQWYLLASRCVPPVKLAGLYGPAASGCTCMTVQTGSTQPYTSHGEESHVFSPYQVLCLPTQAFFSLLSHPPSVLLSLAAMQDIIKQLHMNKAGSPPFRQWVMSFQRHNLHLAVQPKASGGPQANLAQLITEHLQVRQAPA